MDRNIWTEATDTAPARAAGTIGSHRDSLTHWKKRGIGHDKSHGS
jgi:hypothetical protein